ncbi:hypothetical protein ACQKJZ_04540 [Sphingomonas sp. NPDC019816]|uniref:hypothetical protein n=1 Tax=Sphingomonas sp. NPDC019816 TaxID=3390679 RepID=UPI003CFCC1D9
MQVNDFARLKTMVEAEREAAAVHLSRPMIALTNAVAAYVDGVDLSDEQRGEAQAIRDRYAPAAEPA